MNGRRSVAGQLGAVLLGAGMFWAPAAAVVASQQVHVWEKVEITLTAEQEYVNPYTDVTAWVDLTGPGFAKRCYGFWDGGRTFRVRVLATRPGRWRWRSGASRPDPGLNGREGEFVAVAWSEQEKVENPCRRGMIQATGNGHAFQYADGEPFFLVADTWWATPTFRFPWREDDGPRVMGPEAGFQDYVRYRKRQGFNGVAMIAAFPNWANDGHPRRLATRDGVVLRAAWGQAGTDSAKDMHDEAGNRAFLFPGRVPGFERVFPDLDRINPAYFQHMDRKIDYLNAQGFVPFIEVARRDIGQAWRRFYDWPDSYVRYIAYVWARYQANICLYSPIHFDSPGATIPAAEWARAANLVIERYGPPPFGTLASDNSNPSTLVNFGHVDQAKWLGFHQIGNNGRTHESFHRLRDIFHARPPIPGLNGEPYYAGMMDAPGGSAASSRFCRSAMYGSVLSGGLAGHIYGAGGWDGGLWGANREPQAATRMWEVIQWPSGAQVPLLRRFVLSLGPAYRDLAPADDLLTPNRSGPKQSFEGWAYCARTPDRRFLLAYFEQNCPRAVLSGAAPGGRYAARWYNPRNGRWLDAAPEPLPADQQGRIQLPRFPGGQARSQIDWALRLQRQ